MKPNSAESLQLRNIPLIKVDLSKHTWVKPEYVVNRGTVTQNNTEYEYLVLDTSSIPGIPKLFAICNQGLIAVSNQYPEKYHKAALKHEIAEKIDTQTDKEDEMLCLNCLKQELIEVKSDPNIDYRDYINNRYNFFESIVTYYANMPERKPEDETIFRQAIRSYEYLKELINTLE